MIKKVNENEINIEEHLGLVHLCCQRFKSRGADYDDLFQCGCLGLTKAKKNFNIEKGVKFSTYAVPVILGEIKTFFRDNTPVKISRNIKDLAMKIKYFQEKFINTNQKDPSLNEICLGLNIEQSQILEAMEINRPLVSLDDENEIKSKISVPFDEDKISFSIFLEKNLKLVSKSDRAIIYFRFFKFKTQSETAKKLNTTQVQISRREKIILKNLREKFK